MLINKSNGVEISRNVMMANTFFKRLKGLMFTKELSPDSAMLIHPCSEIHTFFMNYRIDVLYLNINNVILSIDENMEPGKVGKYRKGAVAVIELPAGRVMETGTKVGQTVEIVGEGGNKY